MESWFPVHPSYTRTPVPALGNAAAGTTVTFEGSQKCCIWNATDGTEDDILWQEDDPDDLAPVAAAVAPVGKGPSAATIDVPSITSNNEDPCSSSNATSSATELGILTSLMGHHFKELLFIYR